MVWQDLVISAASILLVYSIIPQVYQGFKRKKGFITIQTSFLTSAGLFAISISMFTLKLYLSSIVIALNAILWLILFVQRLKYGSV